MPNTFHAGFAAFIATVFLLVGALLPATTHAQTKLPSYAAGADVQTKVETVGKKVTDVVSLVVAVIAIVCMVASGAFFAMGNREAGRQLLFGSMAGLLISGLAYGIAALVA
jgi:ABC-type Fe3+ transport system permease subunit